MDGGRRMKVFFLLCLLSVEVVRGDVTCKNQWALHSCGAGNGKRSDVELPETDGRRENVLPGFVSSDVKISNDRDEGGYEAPLENELLSSSSSSQRKIRPRENLGAENEERREWALGKIIEALLKKKRMDYED